MWLQKDWEVIKQCAGLRQPDPQGDTFPLLSLLSLAPYWIRSLDSVQSTHLMLTRLSFPQNLLFLFFKDVVRYYALALVWHLQS